MPRLRSYSLAAAIACAVMLLPGGLTAQAETKVDLTGKWLFNVTTDAGTGTPTVTLKQQGDSLTGHYSSQTLGEADLKGSIKDRKFTLKFQVNVQGTSLPVTYTGNVEGPDALRGTLDLG